MSYLGKTIDRYEFRALLGKGSTGEVYKAFDLRLLRHVAIKVSFPKYAEPQHDRDKIVREAQIIARIEHANIIPVYDVVDNAGQVLIVMRLVEGEDLSQMLRRRNVAFGVKESLRIIRKVLWGMDYAHGKGIVHCDLKPGNILLADRDEVIITDFSLAALLEIQRPEQGKLYGTPNYMSPEQIRGRYLDARSDIYATGMILYRMITGHHPFENVSSLQQLMEQQVERVPERPENLNAEIPPRLANTIMKALEKDPRHRYYTCREFIDDLENITVGTTITDTPALKKQRWDPRVLTNLNARIRTHDHEQWQSVLLVNLSVNGACIMATETLADGLLVQMQFDMPENNSDVTMSVQAIVMWKDVRAGTGQTEYGLNFEGLDDMDKKYIALFIRNLLLDKH